MPITIIDVTALDIRFPTSLDLDGSDAMNEGPDYSAAYAIVRTDHPDGIAGHGLTFTSGRGNELCVAAIESLAPLLIGRTLESLTADLGAFWSSLTDAQQLRWVGPEKGVLHLATGALVNAVWDLYAKVEGKPLWRLLAEMSPEEIVRCVPFRYLTDELTPDEALAILRRQEPTRAARTAELRASGYPAYTTSSGWLGYDDAKIRRLCREGVAAGWTQFKLKVGRDRVPTTSGAWPSSAKRSDPTAVLMVDANQVWDVDQAIDWMTDLAFARPRFIEEPTSPDDILGHARIAQGPQAPRDRGGHR